MILSKSAKHGQEEGAEAEAGGAARRRSKSCGPNRPFAPSILHFSFHFPNKISLEWQRSGLITAHVLITLQAGPPAAEQPKKEKKREKKQENGVAATPTAEAQPPPASSAANAAPFGDAKSAKKLKKESKKAAGSGDKEKEQQPVSTMNGAEQEAAQASKPSHRESTPPVALVPRVVALKKLPACEGELGCSCAHYQRLAAAS